MHTRTPTHGPRFVSDVKSRQTLQQVILLTCFFLSGCAGLVYEIVWIRQLGLVFGSAAPSIGIVLASFMLGLGLGSVLIGRWADRVASPLLLYAVFEGLIGLYALGFGPLLTLLDGPVADVPHRTAPSHFSSKLS